MSMELRLLLLFRTTDKVCIVDVRYKVLSESSEETPLDRELQSKELARIMSAAYPKPVIFLGYVVTLPHAERRTLPIHIFFLLNANTSLAAPYKYMVEDGRVHDIDKDETDRWYVATRFR